MVHADHTGDRVALSMAARYLLDCVMWAEEADNPPTPPTQLAKLREAAEALSRSGDVADELLLSAFLDDLPEHRV